MVLNHHWDQTYLRKKRHSRNQSLRVEERGLVYAEKRKKVEDQKNRGQIARPPLPDRSLKLRVLPALFTSVPITLFTPAISLQVSLM
jgi:hypothetical protein